MRIFLFSVLAFLLMSACGTQERAGGDEADTSLVYATVGDVRITENMINEELNLIPPYQRSSFETPEGKRMLLDHIIERELLLAEAENLGMEEDSFVVAQVELAMQQVEATRDRALIQTYYQQQVVDAVLVPEEEVLAYYNDHMDDIYHQEAQIKVSHVLLESAADTLLVETSLSSGEGFDSIVTQFSQHAPTANAGGNIGWVTANAPMPYLGEQAELSMQLFQTDSGGIVGPVETEMGYHYFMITDKVEEGTRPLDEVRESIENTLRPTLVNSYFEETVIPGLRETYGVTINDDAFLPSDDMSADSLFQAAQNLMETDPEASITYYNLFLRRFPDHENAHQAQFLIGFTLSEYLEEYGRAEEAFQRLIDNYPESDFVDDAQWMVENMGVPPESLFVEMEEAPEADTQ